MSKTKITVNNNGSLKIDGDFEVVDRDGGVYNLQCRDIFLFAVVVVQTINPFVMVHTMVILSMKQRLLICRQRKRYNTSLPNLSNLLFRSWVVTICPT